MFVHSAIPLAAEITAILGSDVEKRVVVTTKRISHQKHRHDGCGLTNPSLFLLLCSRNKKMLQRNLSIEYQLHLYLITQEFL